MRARVLQMSLRDVRARLVAACLLAAVMVQEAFVRPDSPYLGLLLCLLCTLGLIAADLIDSGSPLTPQPPSPSEGRGGLLGTRADGPGTSCTASEAPLLPSALEERGGLSEEHLAENLPSPTAGYRGIGLRGEGPGVRGLAWQAMAAAVGIVGAVVSASLVGHDAWDAQWWWLAAMAVPLLMLVGERLARWWSGERRLPQPDWVELGGMALLFALALAVRVPAITASPPFLFGDEASCGLYGRLFNAGHTPLLSISWFGLPMLSYAVSGVGLRLFGDDLVGLRLINALIGALSIVLTYLLGKEWFGRRAGTLAALVLTFAFLHVELSRNGLHYIQGPTCITLTLYLCTIGLKRGGPIPALLAGMSISLDLQVYWSARVAPLLLAAWFLLLLIWHRHVLFARGREFVWFGLGTVASGLPLAALFRANPGSFNAHQGAVNIFSDDPNTKGHLISQYGHIGTVDLVLQQAWRVLTTFYTRGDASPLFGQWPHPMLDGVTAALLPAACFLALLRWKRWEHAVCLGWFGAVVVAGIITIDPPIWPRLSALLPAMALLVGVLLADAWTLFEPRVTVRWLASAGVVAALAVIAIANLHSVLVDYPAVARQTSTAPTYVGRFLAHAPGSSRTVLLSDGSFFVDYEPIRFLAPRAHGCTLFPGQPLTHCPLARDSKLFVLLAGRVHDLPWLEQQRPGGKVVKVATYNYGSAHILAYELR